VRLGLNLGYWAAGPDPGKAVAANLQLAKDADDLGFAVVWAAEAYGSDAATVLAYVAAQTRRVDVGAAVFQIPARTPTMTAMTAATLDTLSGGRFRLGLGVSGPQVSEGWYGVPFADPLGRTREYAAIVRAALSRERVAHTGEHFTLPIPGGPGKPLHLTVHPVREHIPLYLGAVGPRNVELTGEIADGWLGLFVSPGNLGASLEVLAAGRAKAGRTLAGFDVAPTIPFATGPDVAACADLVRPFAALYVGGMGSRQQNFYNALARRMGFEEAAAAVQDAYLDRRYADAAAALPLEFLDAIALLGPMERIAERMAELAAAGVTTLSIGLRPGLDPAQEDADPRTALRVAAQALERSGAAS
jgi:F420-dependent oxidoreductase-like protein